MFRLVLLGIPLPLDPGTVYLVKDNWNDHWRFETAFKMVVSDDHGIRHDPGLLTSNRGSTTLNVEGGLGLYRASKAALNMLARGLYAQHRARGLTVLGIHPGWARTAVGTLDGAVETEIELEPSVRGVADVVEGHMGSALNLYLDYLDTPLPW